MKVVAIYNPNNEFSRSVEEFRRSLESRTGKVLELVSTETVEGSSLAQLYGIMDYPAIMVVTSEGVLQKLWQGKQLPLMDEVISYIIA